MLDLFGRRQKWRYLYDGKICLTYIKAEYTEDRPMYTIFGIYGYLPCSLMGIPLMTIIDLDDLNSTFIVHCDGKKHQEGIATGQDMASNYP